MAIDTSIYQNIKPVEMPSYADSQLKAANLSQLGLQNQAAQQDNAIKGHMQKLSVLGEALEPMVKMTPEQRAMTYPQVRAGLIQSGVIGPQDAPEQYDDGHFNQILGMVHQTKGYLENNLLKAHAAHFYSEAGKTKSEKEPKQSEFAAATYGTRANQAEKVFGELAKKGFDATSLGSAISRNLPMAFEGFKGEDVKRQSQAERNFVNSILRRESGAAISKDEFSNAENQYFPRQGDTPEVLMQKEENRKTAISALEAEGAPAMPRIARAMGNKTIGSSVPAGKQRGESGSAYADSLPPPPKHGSTEDGYVFMGGDPANKKNWKKAH